MAVVVVVVVGVPRYGCQDGHLRKSQVAAVVLAAA